MYKLMLVEDEPEVLGAMTRMPDWKSLGFQEPVACTDGRHAIEVLKSGFVPHVVITDICMPFMDGVQLTEYLCTHCPSALVVILSGYDDFAYAQKAIQLKVYDYVLKPITPKSLLALAQRLRESLDERRLKHLDETDVLAKDRFFTALLTAPMDARLAQESLQVYGLQAAGSCWLALAIDISLPLAETAQKSRANELLRYGLCNITAELCQQSPLVLFCGGVKESCAVVLNGTDAHTLCAAADVLAQHIAQACTVLGEPVTTGVGRGVEAPEHLHASYVQATLALQYRFFLGQVPCIHSQSVVPMAATPLPYAALEAQFTQAVKNGSRAEGAATLEALCTALGAQRVPPEQCMRYSQRMMLHLLSVMGEYLCAEELQRLETTWEQTRLFSATTLGQLRHILLQVCELAFDSFARAGEDDAALRVRKAEAYIRAHYGDETLSLSSIKDAFSISISYFSAIFKAHTGSTFVEYLTQVRIEKACQLLEHTEKRAGEIAQEIGFSDPQYFSVTFKRVMGTTPRAYRAARRHTEEAKP